jgi:flagellar hook-associated protein 3 FlgL
MVWNNMQRSVALRQTDFAKAQQQAISGKRVAAPSDDPSAFAQARTETSNLARAKDYARNVTMARPNLETTESALYQAEDIMARVRTIALTGANDTLSDTDRATLSDELSGLHEQLVALGNSTNGDRFVFGGYKDGSAPYDATGVYSGDTQVAQVEVSRGVNLPMGVTGEQVFGSAGADVFTTIASLQTALTTSGGSATVSNLLTEVDARYEQVRAVHSQLGNHLNAADIAESVATRAQDTATTNRSNLVDIDAAESYTTLMRMQTALSAAVEIASQLPMPGLASRSR